MPSPWTIRAVRLVLDRWPWLRVYEQDVLLPNGVVIPDFVRLETRGFAMVCALTADGAVVMVESFRMSVHAICMEFPAGGLADVAEDPLACAQRELREETGYAADEWHALGAYAVDANRGLGPAHFFLARGAVRVAEPELDETEEIAVHLLPLDTIRAWYRAGAFRTLPAQAMAGMALARLGEG